MEAVRTIYIAVLKFQSACGVPVASAGMNQMRGMEFSAATNGGGTIASQSQCHGRSGAWHAEPAPDSKDEIETPSGLRTRPDHVRGHD